MPEFSHLDRYIRQMRYPPLGEAGQQKLSEGTALLCGCGALGSVLANTLVRAGVGTVRIVDRDFLELNNLQRQVLYTEADVKAGLPKAIAAKQRLETINSQVAIEAHVADVDHTNIRQLAEGVDVILDGTDNFETRFLLNDASLKLGVPWVYGGCIGAEGQTMTILPGQSPCLRCVHGEPPPPGSVETCDSAGILASIINVVASIQALEAIKILSGNEKAVSQTLGFFDLWGNQYRGLKLEMLRAGDRCEACRGEDFPWLEGRRGSHSAILCGRNAVQLSSPDNAAISLENLESKLQPLGKVSRNPFLLRFEVDDYRLTIFPDGRAIIGGTEEIAEAKTVYAKYIGN